MNIFNDARTVMTLDAGGTNFVFSAIRAGKAIVTPVHMSARADSLERILNNIVEGFRQIESQLDERPFAISFAFPGPADYPKGIIGDLGNLPLFRGGVALGPMLQNEFNVPVHINNDGDLFAYGEAIAGFLPEVNSSLEHAGSPKRYRNLFGVTFGTGFGGGMVVNGKLFLGDNSAGAEIWTTRSRLLPECFAEEGISIRAIKREYAQRAGISEIDSPEPKDIFLIAKDELPGNKIAALEAWKQFAMNAGDALANIITLFDCLVVIGGGLTGASELFLPQLVETMNCPIQTLKGDKINRTELKVFNFENNDDKELFLKGKVSEIHVPGSEQKILYDSLQRTAVGITRLGTSEAVSLGAYAFALNESLKK